MRLKPLDQRILEAARPIVPEIVPDYYTGDLKEYCTWNAAEMPASLGDGRAFRLRHRVQLHWFLPLEANPHQRKAALRRALMETPGFTAPSVTDATDQYGQHYVFEFEAIGGVY